MNRRLEDLQANCAASKSLDRKLTAYLAAAATVGTTLATDADAAAVGNNTVVPFGINGEVPIDWNGDGNPEFEIDHDRLTDMGMETSDPSGIDFLQIDKNDQVELVLPGTNFPGGNMSAEYLADVAENYPAALSLGDLIGPNSPGVFEFQETDDDSEDGVTFGLTRRSNRLIDEDNGFIDANVGTLVSTHTDTPNWLGLNGDVGYLGLRIQLGGVGDSHYGWVGVRVTNEDDATGEVVGFGYNDVPGAPIPAGQIPEPGTMALAALGGITLAGSWITRRFRK